MRGFGLAAVAALVAMPGWAQPGPVFKVDFSNPGLAPSNWTITMHPDGSGHFHTERGTAPVDRSEGIQPPDIDRDIQLSEAFAGHVFQVARQHKLFNTGCDSHLKVAFQGLKRFSYSGPEGDGACEFNYAKDKDIQALGDALVGVAATLVSGARLEMLLQHDRLGLDKEMEYLADAVADGRVSQVCAIRGILEKLSEDPGVMDRVRKRARLLLAQSEK